MHEILKFNFINFQQPSTPSSLADTSELVSTDEEADQSSDYGEFRSTKRPLQKKKGKTLKKAKEDEEFQLLQGIAHSLQNDSPNEKDESVTFGKYVTQCLWKIDERSRLVVRHQIENILFQAQMGEMTHQNQLPPQQLLYQQPNHPVQLGVTRNHPSHQQQFFPMPFVSQQHQQQLSEPQSSQIKPHTQTDSSECGYSITTLFSNPHT